MAAACSPAPKAKKTPEPGQHYRLFFIADLRGELEPCGCTLEPLGGLARLASYLEARKEPGIVPVLITHGDLVSPGKVRAATLPQVRASGVFLQQALMRLGLVASGSGDEDLKLEAEFDALETVDGMPWLRRGQTLRAQGLQLIRDGSTAKPISADRPALLFFDGDRAEAKAQSAALAARGVDLLILPNGGENAALIDLGHGLLALQGGERGQHVIEVDLIWRGKGKLLRLQGAGERQAELEAISTRIEGLIKQRDRAKVRQKPAMLVAARTKQVERAKKKRAQLLASPLPSPPKTGNLISVRRLPLDSNITEDASMTAAVTKHHRTISDLNQRLENSRPCPAPAAADQARFIGSKACRACHAPAYAFWQKTPHAHAWATLEAKGRTYDYSCVGCHSAGFDQPEGFCRVSQAGDRVNVGCENCHGAGSLHAAQGDKRLIDRAVPQSRCTTCHHPPHTNTFVYADRLKRIIGSGHGAP